MLRATVFNGYPENYNIPRVSDLNHDHTETGFMQIFKSFLGVGEGVFVMKFPTWS